MHEDATDRTINHVPSLQEVRDLYGSDAASFLKELVDAETPKDRVDILHADTERRFEEIDARIVKDPDSDLIPRVGAASRILGVRVDRIKSSKPKLGRIVTVATNLLNIIMGIR